ncbi:MAG: tetratricopeptide repeat protein, partial [Syntrophales bacterium]|nr:tetratricopeptide repeat protein [Syntrophales bacterium]
MAELRHIDLETLSLEELVDRRNWLFQHQRHIANDSDALCLWGRIEKRLGQLDAAAHCFQRALASDPDHGDSLLELGYLAADQGRLDEAIGRFRRLTELKPHDWVPWNDGGCVLRAMGLKREALSWMLRATEAAPGKAVLYANTALLLYELYEYDEAQVYLDRAFALEPNHAEALHTQAMLLSGQGQHREALVFEERALAIKPEYPQAKLGLGLEHLILGNLREGFVGYEHRWNGSDKADTKVMITLGKPHWYGQRVYPQSTLAVMPEQGFGDMVQFAQLIPQLLKIFYKVYWFVPLEMYRLVAHSIT